MDTNTKPGVSIINTPSGSFTASSIGTLVQIPLWIGTNTITYPTTLHSQTFSSRSAKFTSSTTSKGRMHWTHTPTHILIPSPLQYTLTLSLQVHMDYSRDIPIPPISLSTLTPRPVASRKIFIAALMSIILNHTWRNTYILVPSCSKNIPLEFTN